MSSSRPGAARAELSVVVLRKGKAKPFWFRHPWVFSGAIERLEGQPSDGELVDVVDSGGRHVARGFYNGRSQIRVRLCTWDVTEAVDRAFFERRLASAIRLRSDLGLPNEATNAYRLVHAEGDGLPGLIVDVFGDLVAVQFSSRGLAAFEEPILDFLEDSLRPAAIVERPCRFAREHEVGPGGDADAKGEEPRLRRGELGAADAVFRENGLEFAIDPMAGQKTGFYLDQRENRALLADLARGRRAFDGHCYVGAFAVALARLGRASAVLAVDSSKAAVEAATDHARRNHIPVAKPGGDGHDEPSPEGIGSITFEVSDVESRLRRAAAAGERFGLVALDPPKLAPSGSDVNRAWAKYLELNRLGIRAVEPGGFLASSSCSGRIDPESFVGILHEAAVAEGRDLQVLHRRSQGPDHPVAISCPEGEYLKFVVCRVR